MKDKKTNLEKKCKNASCGTMTSNEFCKMCLTSINLGVRESYIAEDGKCYLRVPGISNSIFHRPSRQGV